LQFLQDKYRQRPIGVIVVVGSAAYELFLRWRAELWPEVPAVFTAVGLVRHEGSSVKAQAAVMACGLHSGTMARGRSRSG